MKYDKVDLLSGHFNALELPRASAEPAHVGSIAATTDGLVVYGKRGDGSSSIWKEVPSAPWLLGETLSFDNGQHAGDTARSHQSLVSMYRSHNSRLLNFNYNSVNGTQSIVVPVSGRYRVELRGATGGFFSAAASARLGVVAGEVELLAGDVLNVVVGQRSIDFVSGQCVMLGGGGASYIGSRDLGIIAVAGGTGGAYPGKTAHHTSLTTVAGLSGSNFGHSGIGGTTRASGAGAVLGGAGCLAEVIKFSASNIFQYPQMIPLGARGARTAQSFTSIGGFGGGGCVSSPSSVSWFAAGGGGGYSGGSPGGTADGAGGGSSYLIASATQRDLRLEQPVSAASDVSDLNGYVRITRLT